MVTLLLERLGRKRSFINGCEKAADAAAEARLAGLEQGAAEARGALGDVAGRLERLREDVAAVAGRVESLERPQHRLFLDTMLSSDWCESPYLVHIF